MRDVLNPVLELVYPTHCGGCGSRGEVLCPACRASFVAVETALACPVCGRRTGKDVECGECMISPPPFGRGFYGYVFGGPLREALHAFKFEGRKDVGRALVRSLQERITSFADAFDVIIPLPVTERRLKKRGFNQSFIISEEVSRTVGKPVDYRSLLKIKETEDQYTLSREDRKRNVKGAFGTESTGDRIRGQRVLLVDDLYTTGSTAREACKPLLRLKAKDILFFALARTPE